MTKTENTEHRGNFEGRITLERDSMALNSETDYNPYNERSSNQMMHQTLKVEKMKQNNFIEDSEKYKKIEKDIMKL